MTLLVLCSMNLNSRDSIVDGKIPISEIIDSMEETFNTGQIVAE